MLYLNYDCDSDLFDPFRSKDFKLIVTTAPAGFGHIRVMRAILSGLPVDIPVSTIGLTDPSLQFIHKITSTNTTLRALFEFFPRHRFTEKIFTVIYRYFLNRSDNATKQMVVNAIGTSNPKTVLIVCTHFSLAQQIGHIKPELERELQIKIHLAVIVTDDTAIEIWAVPYADYIFVPSSYTAQRLKHLLPRESQSSVIVSPYPVNMDFAHALPPDLVTARRLQVMPSSTGPIEIVIPISGAAVQLTYLIDLIKILDTSKIFHFTVVCRKNISTLQFIDSLQKIPSVQILASPEDSEVVNLYEKAFSTTLFSIEITKPSEQTFKGLLTPRQRGGVLLLFTEPVGRQETDNLAFFTRHGLLPDRNTEINSQNAGKWRGLLLPQNPKDAAKCILNWKENGVFSQMANFGTYEDSPELHPNGTNIFWKKLIHNVFRSTSERK